MQSLVKKLWQCPCVSEACDQTIGFFAEEEKIVFQQVLTYGMREMMGWLSEGAPLAANSLGNVVGVLEGVREIFVNYSGRYSGLLAMFKHRVPITNALAVLDWLQQKWRQGSSEEMILLKTLQLVKEYCVIFQSGYGAFSLAMSNAVQLINSYCVAHSLLVKSAARSRVLPELPVEVSRCCA